MLRLEFEGYFQMRMATDPDPTDERRGVSGYTFAVAGEPDFDAKVHFQPDERGVYERDFGPLDRGPRVGVNVRRATRDGRDVPDLVGARVALVDAQVLEHNGVLVRNDYFILDPLRARVTVADPVTREERVILDREDWLNPANPGMPSWEATAQMLLRRQPKRFVTNSTEVAAVTGLPDAGNETLIKNRDRRRESLEALLEEELGKPEADRDPAKIAGLETRIGELKIVRKWWDLSEGTWDARPIDRRAYTLALQLEGWDVDINGRVHQNRVGADETRPWPLRFWFGGWDGDALCAYARGTWEIPLA